MPNHLRFALALLVLTSPTLHADLFGVALASIGDLDGDGASDLLVGEMPRLHPDGSGTPGRALVLSGDGGAVLLEVATPARDDSFGSAVAGPGDLDGDGLPDLLVAALEGGADGRSYVRAHSGADGALLAQRSFARGRWQSEWNTLGASTQPCALGDVDKDGVPDWAVGAWTEADGRGALVVVSGASGEELARVLGSAALVGLGASVAPAGDLDEDGAPDLFVGSRPLELHEGELNGRRGGGSVSARSGRDLSALFERGAFEGDGDFGFAVEAVGDWDADGVGDVAVGAPFGVREQPSRGMGRARVLSGVDGAPLAVWEQDQLGGGDSSFGGQLLALEEREDAPALLVAAPRSMVSRVHLVRPGNPRPQRRLTCDEWSTSHFGVAATTLADVDGDGLADFAIGANSVRSGGYFPGRVCVFSGAELAPLYELSRP